MVDTGYIDSDFVVLFRLDTLRESHCFSFDFAIRVERGQRLHTLVSRHNLRETAIGIVFEFLNSNTTSKSAALR